MCSRRLAQISLLLAVTLAVSPLQTRAQPETLSVPVELRASDVLPPSLLEGPNYRVDANVENDGFMNRYTVVTEEHGSFTVEGTAGLKIRIGELRALAAMAEISRSKEFGAGAWDAAKGTAQTAGDLVTSPIDTSKSIFSGTGKFLGNVGRSLVSSDPHQDNVLKTALGYDAAKRAYAYEFGVDPYSSFKPVNERVGQLARATVAGGLTVSMGMSVATAGTFGAVLQVSKTSDGLRKVVRDHPPGELAKRNRETLEGLGIETALIDALLRNYVYNPSEATLLVGELATLDGVTGHDVLLAAATAATDEDTARYWRLKTQMMAGYHANVARVVRIQNLSGWPTMVTADGKAVSVDPVDYPALTRDALIMARQSRDARSEAGIRDSEYWITGRFEPSMRAFLEEAGWTLVEDADSRLLR